jgi:biopolymer transport protein ExbD
MGMSVGTGEGRHMIEVNTTPLIDVMLCLLIILIFSVPIMTHAIKMDMPQVSSHQNDVIKPDPIELEIDYDGTLVWNGTVVPDLETLEGHFRSAAAQEFQPELHLRPDRRAKYDTVAKVLAAAQRNRLKNMGFVNTSEFRD